MLAYARTQLLSRSATPGFIYIIIHLQIGIRDLYVLACARTQLLSRSATPGITILNYELRVTNYQLLIRTDIITFYIVIINFIDSMMKLLTDYFAIMKE